MKNTRPSGPNTGLHSFPALDGVRGVAAILVALFHLRNRFLGFNNFPGGDGYLAVDLFFVLSGFVLSHAYLPRFQNGMSASQFMKARLIRLYPLYFIGFVIGAMIPIIGVLRGHDRTASAGSLIRAFMEIVILPSWPISIDDKLFFINPVAWSLLMELVVNLLFVVFWKRLNPKMLFGILAISGIIVLIYTLYQHTAVFGYLWRNAPMGLARTIFSFSMGVLIHHFYKSGKLNYAIRFPYFAAGILILIIYLLFPVNDKIRGLYDLIFIILISPALVALGTNINLGNVWLRIFSSLGSASYALYVIHHPMAAPTEIFLQKVFGISPFATPIALISVSSFVVLGYVLDQTYDRLARRYLTERI
jgi:peptidoglycan/LPS O-acetylase OafA/YrhL